MILAQESGSSGLSSLLFFVVLAVGMYLLIIRPQRKRAKQLLEVRSSLAPGARVITTAGLHAEVAEVRDDGTVLLEIAPGVRAVFLSASVVRVLDDVSAEPTAEPGPAS